MLPSSTHLVLIPSYNPGGAVFETVRGACAAWAPVWVVVDGSTDGTLEGLRALTVELPQLRVRALPQNSGKGWRVAATRRPKYSPPKTIGQDYWDE